MSDLRTQLSSVIDEHNQDQQQPVEINAPDDWSDDDKKYFGTIPNESRQWFLDRDKGYRTAADESSTKIKNYETRYADFDKVFEPHNARMAQYGQTPVQVIENLLKAQFALENSPKEAFAYLAKMYNFDLSQLAGGEKPNDADQDPLAGMDPGLANFLRGLKSQIDGLSTNNNQRVDQERQQAAQQTQTTITSFRDSVDDKGVRLYPHMDKKEVADYMAQLIKSGMVKLPETGDISPALKLAYDQAVHALPEIRKEILAASRPELPASRARLEAARRAGASVTGKSAGTASQPEPKGVRGALQAAWENSTDAW